MLKIVDDERLIAKVCTMYYIDDMSQKQISQHLGLSRPTISRMVANGKKLGLVEITVKKRLGTEFVELEREIEDRLNLREVLIVPNSVNQEETRQKVGQAGAQLLERLIKDKDIVGLSMGPALDALCENIGEPVVKGTQFVPLVGALGAVKLIYHSNSLAERMASAYRGKSLMLHAPGRVNNKETKEIFLEEPSIKQVMKSAAKMNIALLGIEALEKDSNLMSTGYYTKEDLFTFNKKNAIGDICLQLFDIRGSKKACEDLNYVLGIDINLLKQVKYTVGLTYGVKNAKATIGAARGKYINTLVLDEECAREVINVLGSKRLQKR